MTGEGRPSPPEVIQAERFELVDADGQVRAVIGSIGTGDEPPDIIGLELRDRRGSARAWLSFEEGWGTQLCLAERGNQVLVLQLVEPAPEAGAPGPAIVLCTPDGAPVAEWRVDQDGRFHPEVGGA